MYIQFVDCLLGYIIIGFCSWELYLWRGLLHQSNNVIYKEWNEKKNQWEVIKLRVKTRSCCSLDENFNLLKDTLVDVGELLSQLKLFKFFMGIV